jgi:hypothetical protein
MCDTNWYVVRREYQDRARIEWEDGEIDKSEDGRFTYASETADSSQYVIYYGYQRELWADSQDIRDYEDDAIDAGCVGVAEIQQYCVYMALQDAIRETLDELCVPVTYQQPSSPEFYLRTDAMSMFIDVMGDDLDGIACMMEDAEYLGLLEEA